MLLLKRPALHLLCRGILHSVAAVSQKEKEREREYILHLVVVL